MGRLVHGWSRCGVTAPRWKRLPRSASNLKPRTPLDGRRSGITKSPQRMTVRATTVSAHGDVLLALPNTAAGFLPRTPKSNRAREHPFPLPYCNFVALMTPQGFIMGSSDKPKSAAVGAAPRASSLDLARSQQEQADNLAKRRGFLQSTVGGQQSLYSPVLG